MTKVKKSPKDESLETGKRGDKAGRNKAYNRDRPKQNSEAGTEGLRRKITKNGWKIWDRSMGESKSGRLLPLQT